VQDIVESPGGLSDRMFAEVEGAIANRQPAKAIDVSFRDSPFELILQNQDLDQLATMSQQLANRLRTLTNAAGKPMLKGVHVGYEVDKPELRLSIDRSRAASLGVSVRTSRAPCKFSSADSISARIKIGGKEYKVMVQTGTRLPPHAATARHRVRARQQGRIDPVEHGGETRDGGGPQRHQPLPASAQRQHHRVHRVGPIGTVVKAAEANAGTELPAGFLYAWGG